MSDHHHRHFSSFLPLSHSLSLTHPHTTPLSHAPPSLPPPTPPPFLQLHAGDMLHSIAPRAPLQRRLSLARLASLLYHVSAPRFHSGVPISLVSLRRYGISRMNCGFRRLAADLFVPRSIAILREKAAASRLGIHHSNDGSHSPSAFGSPRKAPRAPPSPARTVTPAVLVSGFFFFCCSLF